MGALGGPARQQRRVVAWTCPVGLEPVRLAVARHQQVRGELSVRRGETPDGPNGQQVPQASMRTTTCSNQLL